MKRIRIIVPALAVVASLVVFNVFRGSMPRMMTLSARTLETLQETGGPDESANPDWWLNSGGMMTIEGATAKTIQGELHLDNSWRKIYANSNPNDTDNGARPQNIFRLISRSRWENVEQEGFFFIHRYNASPSKNHNNSNGILFFQRYQDDGTFYYVGLRVDGEVIINKKVDGVYYTVHSLPFLISAPPGQMSEMKIPLNTWIGIKSSIRTAPDGNTHIRVFLDIGAKGTWTLAIETYDNGKLGSAILPPGHVGIRTDFMDVEFRDYRVTAL